MSRELGTAACLACWVGLAAVAPAVAAPTDAAALPADQAAACAEFGQALDAIVAGRGGQPPSAGDGGHRSESARGGGRSSESAPGGGRSSASARLTALWDAYWRFGLLDSPEDADSVGFSGLADRWEDLSAAAYVRRRALAARVVAAAESIDRRQLAAGERLNYDLFLRRVRLEKEGNRFPVELMPIGQFWGLHTAIAEALAAAPARTSADYAAMIARLRAVPRLLDEATALMARGLAAGVTPARVTLRDVPDQVAAVSVEDPAQSPMLAPFRSFPPGMAEAERESLRQAAYAAYRDAVRPAYARLRAYLIDTYIPQARESVGWSALPDGAAWYAYQVKRATTTDRTPEDIHQLGLAEVKRIRGEMDRLIAASGFTGSFADFQVFLRTDPRFYFDRPEDLLMAYRDLCKRIDPELVKIFGKLPRLPYGVQEVPAYAAKSQTTAYYSSGSVTAGRPGIYYANTYNLKARPKWAMEALTLHEAVPGHHLQSSLAEEAEALPAWRRYGSYTAYIEGWGLYAESLGEELGLYRDPYSKFGQLSGEMWRALRLVVDTGIHAQGWSRQQAIDYMKANSARPEHDVEVEVDRYIVNPGQALAYKIGQLKIRELRTAAERQLGEDFDERAFHDHLLEGGALPLDVLEERMRSWTAEQAAKRPAAASPAAKRPAAAN